MKRWEIGCVKVCESVKGFGSKSDQVVYGRENNELSSWNRSYKTSYLFTTVFSSYFESCAII